MFGFGKQKSLHLLFLQTVAASHSSRVNFQQIWNSHRHVADIEPINRGDEDLIRMFDVYNRLMNAMGMNQRGLGGDPIAQTLPIMMYFSLMKDAYAGDDSAFEDFSFKPDQDEKNIFTNFNFTSYMPIGKHLTERYMAFLKNYQPFAAFGDETIAILRFFLFEIKKLNEDIPGMEEFISLVMSDFKKLHIEIWKNQISWQDEYPLNRETNNYFHMIKSELT